MIIIEINGSFYGAMPDGYWYRWEPYPGNYGLSTEWSYRSTMNGPDIVPSPGY